MAVRIQLLLHQTTANATTTGGGSITAAYQINTGLDTIVSGTGWGAGLWGGTTAADPATTLNGGASMLILLAQVVLEPVRSLTDASAFHLPVNCC